MSTLVLVVGRTGQLAVEGTGGASGFAATADLGGEGEAGMHQAQPFSPIYLRKRALMRLVSSNPDAPGPAAREQSES